MRASVPILLAFLSVAHAETVTLKPGQADALGIAAMAAESANPARPGGFPGRVTVPNGQLRVVAAPLPGRIESLAVAPGEAVKRGQVVATLASPQALELQRDILQSGSQADLARRSRERDEQLFAEGLIPESRLQASRAAATQAAAQAGERRQGLALAGAAAGKLGGPLALTAPIDGVVLEQGAQVGQQVEASALIYRVARLAPLWLEIQAPVAVAAGLKEGMPVRVAGSRAEGKLIAVGRAVEGTSQSVLLRARVEAGAETLRPGQVVEVELPTPAGSGQPLLAAALVRHAGKTVVFVAVEGGFRVQPVEVLSLAGETAVVAGVKPGERVAVKGTSALKALWTGVGRE